MSHESFVLHGPAQELVDITNDVLVDITTVIPVDNFFPFSTLVVLNVRLCETVKGPAICNMKSKATQPLAEFSIPFRILTMVCANTLSIKVLYFCTARTTR